MRSVLIIDDDIRLSGLLCQLLAMHKMSLTMRHSGTEGLSEALERRHDLVILDAVLPDLHGFEVLQRLRESSDVPVIMLTAWGDAAERVRGLRMGADDYLPKPFNVEELAARIDAVLRRSVAKKIAEDTLGALQPLSHRLTIDQRSRTALYGVEKLVLTDIEFSLLERFLRSPGIVLSREDLTEQVLRRSFHPLDRSLDMSISRLRRKLRMSTRLGNPIKTIRSSGYMFSASESSALLNQPY
jgi:two-component system, OmpR family, response regulator CpxR